MADYLGCLIGTERIVASTHDQQLRPILLQEGNRFGQQHLLVDRPGASRAQGDVEDVALLASVSLLPFSHGEDPLLVQGTVPGGTSNSSERRDNIQHSMLELASYTYPPDISAVPGLFNQVSDTVTVMHVEVQYRHPFDSIVINGMAYSSRREVEYAEPHGCTV